MTSHVSGNRMPGTRLTDSVFSVWSVLLSQQKYKRKRKLQQGKQDQVKDVVTKVPSYDSLQPFG